jgi:hypothetical protein
MPPSAAHARLFEVMSAIAIAIANERERSLAALFKALKT